MALTTDKKARKNAPMDRGLLAYFPNALAGVAELSRIGNEQHNPGEEMHWARDKSKDHGDCIIRHQADWDQLDEDGMPHCAKVAWRALAQYEEYLIARGAIPGRGTRISTEIPPLLKEPFTFKSKFSGIVYTAAPDVDNTWLVGWSGSSLGIDPGSAHYAHDEVAKYLANGDWVKVRNGKG